ncbi:hypothetical protein Kpol_1056p28 [Vanderwaltozyma polyspora DSM 70294]|uniref:Uncharacterized protein n=1 Tax=Vanderwaltozyma polyspora (strain ATCC 22028 / DSM 70294 / BCRC 21397 / CBS 2163 / NBRC 10782 / NRRL Y-8283 / UCD 57-17) TaxID=436907 RepID=A7TLN5_VANPO|nr:uncharacterized protein Kpol_1056p28 [Vanderwaltozyma polyspora DSM 70294]EDO16827.1 hypothetical protein Kpol_1056p28 [Vanderwaltozyma polyspora DSM 70294]
MGPELRELIVLQVVYSLLISNGRKLSDVNSTEYASSVSGFSSGAVYKVSLVKLANEVQNNILINQMVGSSEAKLDISDILQIIRALFPKNRTILVDGQINFHKLELNKLREELLRRYTMFKTNQINQIKSLEDELISGGKTQAAKASPSIAESSSASTSTATPAASLSPTATTGKKNKNIVVVDPKREKLLQLYRDTVLNKLQGKNKLFDELYDRLDKIDENDISSGIVYEDIQLDRIKNETPSSVHDLQLILQRSICDSLMRFPVGSENWKLAKQVQIDLDETVQFMRRALE